MNKYVIFTVLAAIISAGCASRTTFVANPVAVAKCGVGPGELSYDAGVVLNEILRSKLLMSKTTDARVIQKETKFIADISKEMEDRGKKEVVNPHAAMCVFQCLADQEPLKLPSVSSFY
jgi:hypothetical protein